MKKRSNKILISILVPFLLVFITIFLTHTGLQTNLIDQEQDQFSNENLITQIQIVKNYFIAEEVIGPTERLHWIISSNLMI